MRAKGLLLSGLAILVVVVTGLFVVAPAVAVPSGFGGWSFGSGDMMG